ncbi:gamma-glutamylcyclotransferase [Actibacterium sp. XHP0104]|uniref:gamma-glutamylcyclotransferase n=1 Tax=Actibacterium sp. XHP0104 TaxID=2984335 RepID=UPI0021E98D2F|nr:gamma-glutamylcyclotransferase [Actibacterium sp. XHP0104]MCV2882934.1 gamma-glutamylcyclotransferase [Actibacterium sp. XHP0104]
MSDPFAHHPGLRGKITDPERSFFRGFRAEDLVPMLAEQGLPVGWWHSDADREALRRRALSNHPGGDLWVFAYGSLMWDPGFRFAEVRRAYAPGYARRFILRDIRGARGRPDAPGLMAALDHGPGCEGLAFRIAEEVIEHETQILCRRELIEPAYHARFVEVDLGGAQQRALTFVADHDAPTICPDLTQDEQVRLIATGTGVLGSSLEYLANIASQFQALGIHDDDVMALLAAVEAHEAPTGRA